MIHLPWMNKWLECSLWSLGHAKQNNIIFSTKKTIIKKITRREEENIWMIERFAVSRGSIELLQCHYARQFIIAMRRAFTKLPNSPAVVVTNRIVGRNSFSYSDSLWSPRCSSTGTRRDVLSLLKSQSQIVRHSDSGSLRSFSLSPWHFIVLRVFIIWKSSLRRSTPPVATTDQKFRTEERGSNIITLPDNIYLHLISGSSIVGHLKRNL